MSQRSCDELPIDELSVDELAAEAVEVLRAKAVREFDEPIQLASGAMSRHFVDGKAGLAAAADLRLACAAIAALCARAGIGFDAAGGLTLGADHLGVGVAMVTDRSWFFVRKEPKDRGTGRQIEGAEIGPGVRVLVVEDVVSTGGSLLRAIDIVQAAGAEVVAAATLMNRGDVANAELDRRGIPFVVLSTYADFGMDPVQG
ncbi:MAG: orotate phosphoribosyltransferase [Actinomycetia bacterium]|nr:orotate phosphoribosyltransferase [Actinomycetes bacterium]MCP4961496.1 orotate phosphoribosyltransferase [Actinomycetes bacterium]